MLTRGVRGEMKALPAWRQAKACEEAYHLIEYRNRRRSGVIGRNQGV